ncbi:hypothetical protein ABZ249_29920 [Nocardiopsis sp. NPDC006139]|uniref:hypothetical protein n=1 Tax=Nocardiopsis sp. NPDC006139 TaxID=3154578 RepID=UPI0033B65AE1
MSEPTTEQVHAVMAALGTPHTDQHHTLGADFAQWQMEDTIRRVWPHIVNQAADILEHDARTNEANGRNGAGFRAAAQHLRWTAKEEF